MHRSFGFFDLLTHPVFINVVIMLFILSLVLLVLNRKKFSFKVRVFWIILLLLCALYLLFVLLAALMWGQPPAAPPVPAPPLG